MVAARATRAKKPRAAGAGGAIVSIQTACGLPVSKGRLSCFVGLPEFGVGLATPNRTGGHGIDLVLAESFCQLVDPRRIGLDKCLFRGSQNAILQHLTTPIPIKALRTVEMNGFSVAVRYDEKAPLRRTGRGW